MYNALIVIGRIYNIHCKRFLSNSLLLLFLLLFVYYYYYENGLESISKRGVYVL